MILALWLAVSSALAIDNNDHLILELAGGEQVEGWYLRAEPSAVVVTVPVTGEMTTVPLSILTSVTVNDQPQAMDQFRRELSDAWSKERAWLSAIPGTLSTS